MGECITVIPGPVELFILGSISPMGIDPVGLNLRACALNCHTQFARIVLGGGVGQGVGGLSAILLAERISVLIPWY